MTPPLILIAEGQADLRQKVREYLEQSGFRALPAASANDIWSAIDAMPIGAVVLDAALRGPDGMDLCRDVRERSDVPIILVGAQSTEVDRVVGLELGADDYMAKPFDFYSDHVPYNQQRRWFLGKAHATGSACGDDVTSLERECCR